MGHHLKDTTAKQTQMAVLTKLLAGGAVGVGKVIR